MRKFIASLCVSIFSESCGTDRNNPGLPSETEPVQEGDAASANSDSASYSEDTEYHSLPVESVGRTIIYTPQEEAKKGLAFANCSRSYQVSTFANPFLAGMPNYSEIVYTNSINKSPENSPVQIVAIDTACMLPGNTIYFKVDGKISFGQLPGQEADADGQSDKIVRHALGNVNHIAMTNAPFGSLVAVFLDDTPTQNRTTTPPRLRFGSEINRNFKILEPTVGQIFFIGDGKDSVGNLQAFLVPQGATRLYVATMAEYELNINFGQLTVEALWLKP